MTQYVLKELEMCSKENFVLLLTHMYGITIEVLPIKLYVVCCQIFGPFL